jgi:hypothetical protein
MPQQAGEGARRSPGRASWGQWGLSVVGGFLDAFTMETITSRSAFAVVCSFAQVVQFAE